MQVIIINGVPLFFAQRDDIWFPTLRLLHQYPDMMPKLRADTGAIKFVVSGANIMCPGLTSPGATLHAEVLQCCYVMQHGRCLSAWRLCYSISNTVVCHCMPGGCRGTCGHLC